MQPVSSSPASVVEMERGQILQEIKLMASYTKDALKSMGILPWNELSLANTELGSRRIKQILLVDEWVITLTQKISSQSLNAASCSDTQLVQKYTQVKQAYDEFCATCNTRNILHKSLVTMNPNLEIFVPK